MSSPTEKSPLSGSKSVSVESALAYDKKCAERRTRTRKTATGATVALVALAATVAVAHSTDLFGASVVEATLAEAMPSGFHASEEPQPSIGAGIGADHGPGAYDSDACIANSSAVMSGFDVVAYYSLEAGDKAVQGSSTYSSTYNGYSFYFESDTNKAEFEASPTSYLPKYGGFCSYGITEEGWWTWDTIKESGPNGDPNVWEIIGGELFFFMYEVPKYKFDSLCSNDGMADLIAKGDTKWSNYTSGETDSYFNTDCFWWDDECGMSNDECITDITSDWFSCETFATLPSRN